MKHAGIVKAALLLSFYALTTVLAGCVVAEHREGYYDRHNGRWYHNHEWVVCHPGDEHCH